VHPLVLIAAIVAALAGAGSLLSGDPGVLVGLAVLGGLLYVLHQSRSERGLTAGATTSSQVGEAAVAADPAGLVPGAGGAGSPGAVGSTSTAVHPAPVASSGSRADLPPGAEQPKPPAWDPLGAAPFAWDLPEPTPLPDPTVQPRRRTVLPQVTLGLTLLVGAALTGGVFAGWWALTWAQVSAITLAVLALGLLLSALRGAGRSLIGGGVFLALVTLALAVTGISGTAAYGATHLQPATLAQVQDSYSVNAGEFDLDLSAVRIPANTTKTVDVEVKAGHALVQVPAGVTVNAVCSADVGHTDCLGNQSDGLRQQSTGTTTGAANAGTLQLNVKVRAGFAEVVPGG
jgi:hypothetical protein